MKYNITKPSTPKTPTLGNGTVGIKILLSHTSKDIYKPLVPMFFPYLAFISSSRISVPRPHLEGSLWPNGQPSNRYGRQQSPIVHSCRRPSVATSVITTTMPPKYSSTPFATHKFYKSIFSKSALGRMSFSYKDRHNGPFSRIIAHHCALSLTNAQHRV